MFAATHRPPEQLAPDRIDFRHKREVDNQLFLADYSRGVQPIVFEFLRVFGGQGAGQFDAKSTRSVVHVVIECLVFHLFSLQM